MRFKNYFVQPLGISALLVMLAASMGLAQETISIEKALLKIQQSVEIPAESDGVLTEVSVTEGDIIEKGALIARINEAHASLKLAEAEIDVDIEQARVANDIDVRYAEKSMEVAKANLLRAESAVERSAGSVSAAEMDRLKLIVEQHKLALEQAGKNQSIAAMNLRLKQIIVDQRKKTMEQYTVYSPLSGMVVAAERSVGEWVNTSDTVARVVRIDKLRVEGFVTAEQAAPGLAGRKVEFKIELPHLDGEQFLGTLTFVNPDAIPINGKLRVWAEIDNSSLKLVPGLQGTLVIYPE
jgi:multidrug efflux pump subunit AcrA (membrane-fusion protein)